MRRIGAASKDTSKSLGDRLIAATGGMSKTLPIDVAARGIVTGIANSSVGRLTSAGHGREEKGQEKHLLDELREEREEREKKIAETSERRPRLSLCSESLFGHRASRSPQATDPRTDEFSGKEKRKKKEKKKRATNRP